MTTDNESVIFFLVFLVVLVKIPRSLFKIYNNKLIYTFYIELFIMSFNFQRNSTIVIWVIKEWIRFIKLVTIQTYLLICNIY